MIPSFQSYCSFLADIRADIAVLKLDIQHYNRSNPASAFTSDYDREMAFLKHFEKRRDALAARLCDLHISNLFAAVDLSDYADVDVSKYAAEWLKLWRYFYLSTVQSYEVFGLPTSKCW